MMKWILDHIKRLIAAYFQKHASGHEQITPAGPYQTDLVLTALPRRSSERINCDATRKKPCAEYGLKDIPGVTTRMLIAFGKHGIKSIGDLADCATDDLHGWSETKDGKTIRHTGILGRFKVSRQDCETMIMNARTKAGWFK